MGDDVHTRTAGAAKKEDGGGAGAGLAGASAAASQPLPRRTRARGGAPRRSTDRVVGALSRPSDGAVHRPTCPHNLVFGYLVVEPSRSSLARPLSSFPPLPPSSHRRRSRESGQGACRAAAPHGRPVDCNATHTSSNIKKKKSQWQRRDRHKKKKKTSEGRLAASSWPLPRDATGCRLVASVAQQSGSNTKGAAQKDCIKSKEPVPTRGTSPMTILADGDFMASAVPLMAAVVRKAVVVSNDIF